MLLEELKKRMFAAMKADRKVEKEILRVCVGELETVASRSDKPLNLEEEQAVLRRLLKSNEESLGLTEGAEQRGVLEQENEVLRSFLPSSLSVLQIQDALEPVLAAIRAASGDGPAVGIAMKQLKLSNARVEGKDVAAAVKQLRE